MYITISTYVFVRDTLQYYVCSSTLCSFLWHTGALKIHSTSSTLLYGFPSRRGRGQVRAPEVLIFLQWRLALFLSLKISVRCSESGQKYSEQSFLFDNFCSVEQKNRTCVLFEGTKSRTAGREQRTQRKKVKFVIYFCSRFSVRGTKSQP